MIGILHAYYFLLSLIPVPLCTLRKWAEAETGYQGWSFDHPISFVFALQTKKNALLRCTTSSLWRYWSF